jgi:hypothetical protein
MFCTIDSIYSRENAIAHFMPAAFYDDARKSSGCRAPEPKTAEDSAAMRIIRGFKRNGRNGCALDVCGMLCAQTPIRKVPL